MYSRFTIHARHSGVVDHRSNKQFAERGWWVVTLLTHARRSQSAESFSFFHRWDIVYGMQVSAWCTHSHSHSHQTACEVEAAATTTRPRRAHGQSHSRQFNCARKTLPMSTARPSSAADAEMGTYAYHQNNVLRKPPGLPPEKSPFAAIPS